MEVCVQLGNLQFVTHSNKLEVNAGDMISKFVDDITIGGVTDNEDGCLRLQQNIEQMEIWVECWQIQFAAF